MSKLLARLKRQKRELSDALDTIRVLATVDELTSLVNRRHMNAVLDAEERRRPGGAGSDGTCILSQPCAWAQVRPSRLWRLT